MRPFRSRARKPVTSESSIALRKASVSAIGRLGGNAAAHVAHQQHHHHRQRQRQPLHQRDRGLGIRLGEPRVLTTRSAATARQVDDALGHEHAAATPHRRCAPGCRAVALDEQSSCVPPSRATDSSSSRVSAGVATKPSARPARCNGMHRSIISMPSPSDMGTK